MGGQPQQQQRELSNLGQSAVASQLSGDMGGILGGALPQQKQEYQQMNNPVNTPDAMQTPMQMPDRESGVLGPSQPGGMALFSPLHQFLLANSGNNPLLNNIAGMMGMPNRSGSF
jgi:hypothetical protein